MTQSHIAYRNVAAPRPAPRDPAGLPTHYMSESQGRMAIKDMNDHHLNAAIVKLATAPGTSTTLAALRAEKARRT